MSAQANDLLLVESANQVETKQAAKDQVPQTAQASGDAQGKSQSISSGSTGLLTRAGQHPLQTNWKFWYVQRHPQPLIHF